MTAAIRKAAERQRRAARGEVALSGWLTASDHAALTQMARDSGMTQGQVVSRLIGMVGAVRGLEPVAWQTRTSCGQGGFLTDTFPHNGNQLIKGGYSVHALVRHSDLTAAVGL